MAKLSKYQVWKRITKIWVKRDLIFVCHLDTSGAVTAYISQFPKGWSGKQRLAYQDLYYSISKELRAQFERKKPPVVEGGDFFSSLSKAVEAVPDQDPEIQELDYATNWKPSGHWKAATWEGLRFWFCPVCGGSFWYVGFGCGRTEDGIPHVFCYRCLPPRPGVAVACGRSEWTDDRFILNHREPPQPAQDRPPPAAGQEWEKMRLEDAEDRRWAVRAAIAPTPLAAWRALPQKLKAILEGRGIKKNFGR